MNNMFLMGALAALFGLVTERSEVQTGRELQAGAARRKQQTAGHSKNILFMFIAL